MAFSRLALGGFATRRTAMVATDLIRAAQFHHATGVWIAALPPLSLYQTGPRCKNDQDIYSHQPSVAMQTFTLPAILTGEASKPRKSLEAIALRSELWRRYPMKTVFCWSDVTDIFVTSEWVRDISGIRDV